MKRLFILSNLFLLPFTVLVYGQTNSYYEEKLTPEDPGMWPQFGLNVFVYDEEVVIYGDGALHCYRLNNGNWYEFQTITEPNAFLFGRTFQFDEEYLVVGAPGNIFTYPDNSNGEVYLYRKIDGLWMSDTVLTVQNEDVFEFGRKTYINENKIIVKARIGTSWLNEAIIYSYENDGGNFNFISQVQSPLENINLEWDITFEESHAYIVNKKDLTLTIYDVSMNDNWIIMDSVSTYLDSTICEGQTNTCSLFGSKIFYLNNYLFVGSPIQGDSPYSGFVFVYQKINEEWSEHQILSIEDVNYAIGFGYSIDGNDSTIVIGAPYSRDAGQASGSVYIFKNIDGTWQQVNKIISSDLENGDMFGTTVSMMDDYVFIGAPLKNGLEGAVYVYNPHDTSLHANFAGDVRNGNAPVTVQFTAVPQGNPTAYEWDFNSDGFIDSTEPNPQFTYYIDDVYTVTLTVYDETGSDAEVKTDYIRVVSDILFGDVNGDGFLNVSDLVMYIDFILGYSEPEEDQFLAGDVNYSGQIDIIDVVMVIDEILGS